MNATDKVAAQTVEVPAAEVAAKTPKAKTPKVAPSAMVANIRTACEALTKVEAIDKLLGFRVFNSAGSFVVRLPNFRDAVDVLPQSDEAKKALALLKNTRSEVESLTGSAKQTWVFHSSGSFGLYSKLSA
jgi:hypothetical protein